MFCPKCGSQNQDFAFFCYSCGTPLEVIHAEQLVQPIQQPSSQPVSSTGQMYQSGVYQSMSPEMPAQLMQPGQHIQTPKKHTGKIIGLAAMVLAVIIVVIIIVSTIGGQSGPEKNKIISDLAASKDFHAVMNPLFAGDSGYSIQELAVVLEQKNQQNKTDHLQCKITLADSKIKCTTDFNLDYSYYDKGGWILDSATPVNKEKWKSIPLKGVDEETIKSVIQYDSFKIVNHKTDLVNGKDEFVVNVVTNSDMYSESGTVNLNFVFSGNMWILASSDKKTTINYKIIGKWQGMYDYGDGLVPDNYTINITKADSQGNIKADIIISYDENKTDTFHITGVLHDTDNKLSFDIMAPSDATHTQFTGILTIDTSNNQLVLKEDNRNYYVYLTRK